MKWGGFGCEKPVARPEIPKNPSAMRYFFIFPQVLGIGTLGVFLGIFAALSAGAASPEAGATVVVFNSNDPDSGALAEYYARRRDIPASQIIALGCPATEEISRADYEGTIAGPLREIFHSRGWWTIGAGEGGKRVVTATKIRFVALMRGMPLKVFFDPDIPPGRPVSGLPELISSRNEASVDSEMACLGEETYPGIVSNPYFRRFTPILENPVDPGMLLVARLDASTPLIVRAMIDDAILAEREGLRGLSYVDARGITDGEYAEGDGWMRKLAASMRRAGLTVVFDDLPRTFPCDYPITDAAVYYGWYADNADGPFANPRFRFVPGAVAVHIHSLSASTLRSATSNWCGPLLARGAAATLGNVYEPYLGLTAHPDIFQDRLMAGFTLAESAYTAQRALSWMGVVVGDPLYRPYAAWRGRAPKDTTRYP